MNWNSKRISSLLQDGFAVFFFYFELTIVLRFIIRFWCLSIALRSSSKHMILLFTIGIKKINTICTHVSSVFFAIVNNKIISLLKDLSAILKNQNLILKRSTMVIFNIRNKNKYTAKPYCNELIILCLLFRFIFTVF